MSAVLELVVRLGDTILEIVHLPPDRTYRIGTAPACDLAVPGFTSFPLVDGGRLRVPTGIATSEHGGTTRLHVGLMTIDATPMRFERHVIAARRLDRRPPLYIAASLVAHLAIYIVALVFEPFERIVHAAEQPRLRHAHVRVEPPEPPPRKSTAVEQTRVQPAAGSPAARRRKLSARTESAEAAGPASAAAAALDVANMVAEMDLERRLGELRPEDTYNEDEFNARGFGGSRRFQPPGETIKTGDGYKMMLLDVALCPNKSCSVRGPIPALYIRTHLHEVMPAIYGCYEQHASGPGTIVLEFSIDVEGSVRNMRGSGLGETGACAARVASGLYFKALGKDVKPGQSPVTHVRYPIRFKS